MQQTTQSIIPLMKTMIANQTAQTHLENTFRSSQAFIRILVLSLFHSLKHHDCQSHRRNPFMNPIYYFVYVHMLFLSLCVQCARASAYLHVYVCEYHEPMADHNHPPMQQFQIIVSCTRLLLCLHACARCTKQQTNLRLGHFKCITCSCTLKCFA